jgi:AcrR family transcriptional regulator
MSIASRKEREKEQRRSDILQAAEKLFFARGYDNVTMDDIAKAVELNKATIYLYYQDKESLYFSVVLKGVRILSEMVRENESKAKTGFDKLWEIGRAHFSFAKKYPDYNRAYAYFYSGRFSLEGQSYTESIESTMLGALSSGSQFWKTVDNAAHRAGNEIVRQIIELNQGIFILMCDAIRSGIDEGTFRKDLDPEEAAIVFTLLLESVPRMRPDLAKVLEEKGTDSTQFSRDIGNFMGYMLKND